MILEAFLLAVALDLVFGEPAPAFHPVVWIGRLIGFLDRHAPRHFKTLYGLFLALFCICATVITGYGLTVLLYSVSPILSLLATAYLLKSTFSFSFFWDVSKEIYDELRRGDLGGARSKLPALVGRDVSKLDEGRMSSCVIESLGESFVDGIFAPLFYFILFGLPGALAYRAINTLDSMVGYKDEKHIKVGMPSARIDDIANFIPARLAVLLICCRIHPVRQPCTSGESRATRRQEPAQRELRISHVRVRGRSGLTIRKARLLCPGRRAEALRRGRHSTRHTL